MKLQLRTGGVIALVTAGLFCVIAAGAGGFWYGIREGWQLGFMADAAPRGIVATGNLNALKAGKKETVVLLLESEVDNGLLFSYQFLQHPLINYLEPVWGLGAYPDNEKYIARLAKFRKRHPSPFKADAFDVVPPGKESDKEFYGELAAGSHEKDRIIKEMMNRYASD